MYIKYVYKTVNYMYFIDRVCNLHLEYPFVKSQVEQSEMEDPNHLPRSEIYFSLYKPRH